MVTNVQYKKRMLDLTRAPAQVIASKILGRRVPVHTASSFGLVNIPKTVTRFMPYPRSMLTYFQSFANFDTNTATLS